MLVGISAALGVGSPGVDCTGVDCTGVDCTGAGRGLVGLWICPTGVPTFTFESPALFVPREATELMACPGTSPHEAGGVPAALPWGILLCVVCRD